MTRSKVKLAFITNPTSRKATYNKRKKGLLKKVNELSILCDVEICAIIDSPYESQPVVWPNPPQAQRVLTKFKRLPEMEQGKNMLNQESFLMQKIMKTADQVEKQRASNKEKETKEVMYQCLTGAGVQNLGMEEVSHLGRVLDQNLNDITRRMEVLARGEGSKVNEKGKEVMQVEGHEPNQNFGAEPMNMGMNMEFSEWAYNYTGQMSFNSGMEAMLPYEDNSNATWSSAFFR